MRIVLVVLIEWHSFLSFAHDDAPEAVQYFIENYSDVSTFYWPDFIYDDPSKVLSFINQLRSVIRSNEEKNYWLVLPGLGDAFHKIDVSRRERLLGKFLCDVEKEHSKVMFGSGRFPYRPHWPEEIADLVKQVRDGEAAKRMTKS